ncbi:hypothetical protein [Methylobacterium oryzisoli]|uniref:hypothetical protein n=1 Tax=Methylobacterium oryzisoli TaxID=3385502 RepID=UPI003891E8FA
MSAQTMPRLIALVLGAAVLAGTMPAQAQSGYHGGHGRYGGWTRGGHGGVYRPADHGGKVCYNLVGKPYVYKGRGRCPIS